MIRLLAAALAAALAVPGAGGGDEAARSRELLRYRCGSDLGWHEVTLFANGTVRLRRARLDGDRQLRLGELDGEELAAFERRLDAIELREADPVAGGVGGELLDQCELRLLRPAGERRFRFRKLDALPLALSHVVRIAEELEQVAVERDAGGGLPLGYEPRPGDVLVRSDGARFEVRAFTPDARGVELQGIDQPLLLVLAIDGLGGEFVALERPGEER